MLDPQIITEVLKTVEALNAVGLKEAWFSIEPEFNVIFNAWLLEQGYTVSEAEWNAPESLYVGIYPEPRRPLTVFSVKWP